MAGQTSRRRSKKDASTAELPRAVAGERIAIARSWTGRARGGGDPPRRMSQREALAHLLWDMALRGDLAACRLILEYMEGKPVQPRSRSARPARGTRARGTGTGRVAAALSSLEHLLDAVKPTVDAGGWLILLSTAAKGDPGRDPVGPAGGTRRSCGGARAGAGRAALVRPGPHRPRDLRCDPAH